MSWNIDSGSRYLKIFNALSSSNWSFVSRHHAKSSWHVSSWSSSIQASTYSHLVLSRMRGDDNVWDVASWRVVHIRGLPLRRSFVGPGRASDFWSLSGRNLGWPGPPRLVGREEGGGRRRWSRWGTRTRRKDQSGSRGGLSSRRGNGGGCCCGCSRARRATAGAFLRCKWEQAVNLFRQSVNNRRSVQKHCLRMHLGAGLSQWPLARQAERLAPTSLNPRTHAYSATDPNTLELWLSVTRPFTSCGGSSHSITESNREDQGISGRKLNEL